VGTAYFRCGADAAYAGTTPNHHDFYQENNPRTDAFVGFFIAGYKPASAVFTEEVLFPPVLFVIVAFYYAV
jgi:hypothetical protein